MNNQALINAAKRLRTGKDLEALAGAWQEQQVNLILSVPVLDGKKQIISSVNRIHTVNEFLEFVEQISQDTDNGR